MINLEDRGYTPARRDVAELLARLATCDDKDAARIERLVAAHPDHAWRLASASLGAALAPARGRLVDVMVSLAALEPSAERWRAVMALLDDADPKARRNALIGLARVDDPALAAELEAALLPRFEAEPRPDHRRSFIATLGRVGGAASAARLRALTSDDPLTRKELERALLRLARHDVGEAREAPRSLRPTRWLKVSLCTTPGLEAVILKTAPTAWGARLGAPGVCLATLKASRDELFASRVVRSVAVALPRVSRGPDGDLAPCIVQWMRSDEAQEALRCYAGARPRWALRVVGGGQHRAAIDRALATLREALPQCLNDPRSAQAWLEVRVDRLGAEAALVFEDDDRYRYRTAMVAAASHPAVAAALVTVAEIRPDDRVWDPFCGSGVELIERGLAGPYAALYGTDRSAEALAAARTNVANSGLDRVSLREGDAFEGPPPDISLVLTNPPLGHRVDFGVRWSDHLARFLNTLGPRLAPGARMVWLSPDPRVTDAGARAGGFSVVSYFDVDLGGHRLVLQRLDRANLRHDRRRG